MHRWCELTFLHTMQGSCEKTFMLSNKQEGVFMYQKKSIFSNRLTLGMTVLACITAIRVQAQERQLLDGVLF